MSESDVEQMISHLGLSREEFSKRLLQMREFIGQGSASFTPQETGTASRGRSASASRTSKARSMSRQSSRAIIDASPTRAETPIKAEPVESTMPGTRQRDSMEIVLEQQRRARRDKRSHRGRMHNSSPPPGATRSAVGGKSGADGQGASSSQVKVKVERPPSPSPLTPQQSKYYRAHTASQSAVARQPIDLTQADSPEKPTPPTALFQNPHYYPHRKPHVPASAFTTPVRVHKAMGTAADSSPVIPTSAKADEPPYQSSPLSSTPQLVSSPLSAGSPRPVPSARLIQSVSLEGLPYTLPPGPYSSLKPELSYSAILGRAILSSPEHRLTLQEIYDWITIVFPFYKRGETTWMNSIRHVLSTTSVFRKTLRDRSQGRTQWAIWDQDLHIFENGGYRKHIPKPKVSRWHSPETTPATKRGRKSNASPPDAPRTAKKRRIDSSAPVASGSTLPLVVHPAPIHQSYYDLSAQHLEEQQHQSHIKATKYLETSFPSAPASAPPRARVIESRTAPESESEAEVDVPPSPLAGKSYTHAPLTRQDSIPSSDAVPELVENENDSASSPMVGTSELDPEDLARDSGVNLDHAFSSNKAKLSPVQFWGEPPASSDPDPPFDDDQLAPGIELEFIEESMFDNDSPPPPKLRRKKDKTDRTAEITSHTWSSALSRLSSPGSEDGARPSTPPRKSVFDSSPFSMLSPIRTPISHKGLHMSPSASLAHYKSNLNPPPSYDHRFWLEDDDYDPLKTPSKKKVVTSGGSGGALPLTPRKLFPLASDSPFRTPGTTGSVFKSLLDAGDSPIGLFGKNKTRMLYDSPEGFESPSPKKTKWW